MNVKRKTANLATWAAAIIAIGFIVMGIMAILASLPPESTHSHAPGPYDEIVMIPSREGTQVAEALEPVTDAGSWVIELAGVELAHGHKPFPKFCGHYPAARANHNYYPKSYYWSGGYEYHVGELDHLFGADYKYTFRCASRDHHYKDWPQGWF